MSGVATSRALQRLSRPLRIRARAGWLAWGSARRRWSWERRRGRCAWAGSRRRSGFSWPGPPWSSRWVLVVVLAWSRVRALSGASVANRLEELGAWRRGALTALLDRPARGTSDALLAEADAAQAREVEQRGDAAVEPLARPVRAIALAGLGVLLAGLVAFTSAGPLNGAASALWHPAKAWRATVAPVRIAADREVVDRGDSVGFKVEAIGRRTATLWLRAPGEQWHPQAVRLDSLGTATLSSGPLASDVYARVTSGSRASDTVLVKVRLPVFLGELTVTARYPAYLDLEAEPVPTDGDTLLLPAGTRLETRGEATAPLSSAAWETGTRSESLAVSGGAFSGVFVPRASGEYHLALAGAGGAPLAGDTVRLRVRVVADSAPAVEIPVPGADTMAPLSLKVPLVVDARDDYGITSVAVVSRRISRLGTVDSAVRDTLAVPEERPDRAILTHTLDLNRRSLLPGDTVRYYAVAADNTPQRQTGRSREFVLRLPTMSEIRAAQRVASEDVGSQLDSIAAGSRRLERQTEDLARERPRAGATGDRGEESLSFERSKRAEAIAKGQQELFRQAEELKRSLEALRQSAEAAGIGDSAWQRQLQEIRDQLERALSPELRERLAALQRALKDLDADQAREALERLAEGAARDARGAGAQPGTVQAGRAGRRPGQSHPGIPRTVAGTAQLERAGSHRRQLARCRGGARPRRPYRLAVQRPPTPRAADGGGGEAGAARLRRSAGAAGGWRDEPGGPVGPAGPAGAGEGAGGEGGEIARAARRSAPARARTDAAAVAAGGAAGHGPGLGRDRAAGRAPVGRPGSAPERGRSGSRPAGGTGSDRGGCAAPAGAGPEDGRQECAGAGPDRQCAGRRAGADAEGARGDRLFGAQRARGCRAGRWSGGRAQRRGAPTAPGAGGRVGIVFRVGTRRSDGADGGIGETARRTRPAGRRHVADDGVGGHPAGVAAARRSSAAPWPRSCSA